MKKRTTALLLLIFTLISVLSSCDSKLPDITPKNKQYYEYFNTVSVIYSYAGDTDEAFLENCNTVEEILRDYHKLFDIYYKYSGINNLKTVNENAGKSPVKVDSRLIDFLEYSKEMYTLTDGAVNIALGSVLKLWHDARDAASISEDLAYVPDMEELEAAMEHTDINNIIIDRENSTVFISDPKLSIDVGAIGKGYATEKARCALIEKGVTSYVLNIGGNISAIGTKVSGAPWRTSIKSPHKAGEYALTVDLANTSCVTSGDYERYFTIDGVKYHHIIDQITLMPAAYFSSITIITPDSALADALSTALFCMSYEDGLKLASSLEGVDVYWIGTDGTEYMTQGIKDIISD